MPKCGELLCLALMLLTVTGKLLDIRAPSTYLNFTNGEFHCQRLGYDGLAVLSSPELYSYGLEITATLRGFGHGVYLGLRNNSDTNLVTWDDGTVPASDTPWRNTDQLKNFTPDKYGRIRFQGSLIAVAGWESKFVLCGNHKNFPTEAHGVTELGQQPAGVSSSLSVTKVMSYLECVLLCGQDHRCRAAEFNSDFLTCMTLGPGSYSGLTANPQSQTFMRNGFS